MSNRFQTIGTVSNRRMEEYQIKSHSINVGVPQGSLFGLLLYTVHKTIFTIADVQVALYAGKTMITLAVEDIEILTLKIRNINDERCGEASKTA